VIKTNKWFAGLFFGFVLIFVSVIFVSCTPKRVQEQAFVLPSSTSLCQSLQNWADEVYLTNDPKVEVSEASYQRIVATLTLIEFDNENVAKQAFSDTVANRVLGFLGQIVVNIQNLQSVDIPTKVNGGVWYENVFLEWMAPVEMQSFKAEILQLGTGIWKPVDKELVRQINSRVNLWRVDVPGLNNTPGVKYALRVKSVDSLTNNIVASQNNIVALAFDRQGYAFSDNYVNGLKNTTGGYNLNGTVSKDAQVVYVTNENMNQSLNWNRFNTEAPNTPNDRHNLIIRIVGKVGSMGKFIGDYSDIPDAAKYKLGPTEGAVAQSRPFHEVPFRNAHNITVEGIGTDAYIEGWGLDFSGDDVQNIEIRNLKFDKWFNDATNFGATSSTPHQASHYWVHHNTFGHGVDRYSVGLGAADHTKGDGTVDINNGATNFTVSYNIFLEGGKTSLIGGAETQLMGHGTFHHNFFEGTSSRTPRLRNGSLHVFNNLYQSSKTYGVGAGHRANVIAEGNTFIDVQRPYIQSGEMSASNNQPFENSLSNDYPGIVITSVTEKQLQQKLTGRVLQADQFLDRFGKVTAMPWQHEFEYSGQSATKTNNGRINKLWASYTFTPFDSAQSFPINIIDFYISAQDALANAKPNTTGPQGWKPLAAVSDTLSDVGVQEAKLAELTVRALAGVQREWGIIV
jgi:pectate lyase